MTAAVMASPGSTLATGRKSRERPRSIESESTFPEMPVHPARDGGDPGQGVTRIADVHPSVRDGGPDM